MKTQGRGNTGRRKDWIEERRIQYNRRINNLYELLIDPGEGRRKGAKRTSGKT